MKLTMTFGAAIGIAALAACGQSGQDNFAENADANVGFMTNESVLPPDDNAAMTDTLGNQMDQLNESDAMNADMGNVSENTTTNGY